METSSRNSLKLPNAENSTAYARINSTHSGRLGGSQFDIARIHGLLVCILAHPHGVAFMVDEVVDALDQLDVEPPHHVGLLALVAALIQRQRQAAVLPGVLAARFAPGLVDLVQHARLHAIALAVDDAGGEEAAERVGGAPILGRRL